MALGAEALIAAKSNAKSLFSVNIPLPLQKTIKTSVMCFFRVIFE
jgi:hypothetical protein